MKKVEDARFTIDTGWLLGLIKRKYIGILSPHGVFGDFKTWLRALFIKE